MAADEMLLDVSDPREPQPGTVLVPQGVKLVKWAGQPLMLLLIYGTTIPSVMVVLVFVVAVLPGAAT